MAKVRYNLVKSKADAKEYHIRLVFRYAGKKLVYYPGHTTTLDKWSAKDQRLKRTAPHSAIVNERLTALSTLVEKTFLEYDTAGKPLSVAHFRALLDSVWKNRTSAKTEPFELLEFLAVMPVERFRSGELAKDSVRAYNTLLSHLKAFETAKRGTVHFSTIDLDFLPDFVGFLQMRGCAPNSVLKMVKTLKSAMGVAVDRGLTSNMAFRSPRFTARGEKVDHIYLSESDLEKLENTALDERLGNARDLFLMGCCTGLRFGDLTAVKEKDFSTVDGVRILSMLTKKTDTRISVPVLPMAERILARCGGMPRYITNQKLNRYIKEACRAAGIVEQVVTVRISAGRRVEERHAKYELVTTHTARRSFATNEYLRAIREGRDWRPIMAITGHKKESQFFDYIRITSEENAVLFSRQRGAKAG